MRKEISMLVLEVNKARMEPGVANVIKLLDALVSEVREMNDNATIEEFTRNQGKIYAYLQLKDYIIRGIPRMPK